jgi:hypothetical protein
VVLFPIYMDGAGEDVSTITVCGRKLAVIPVAHPNARVKKISANVEAQWVGRCIRASIEGGSLPPRPLADAVPRQVFTLTRDKEPRTGTVKANIVAYLRAKRDPFSEGDFRDAVVAAMQYDPARQSFGISTRFKNIASAVEAWRNQLRREGVILRTDARVFYCCVALRRGNCAGRGGIESTVKKLDSESVQLAPATPNFQKESGAGRS